MLAAMTVIVQKPEEKRTAQQRQRAARFEEFGCTECHKLAPGKLGLTEAGARLRQLQPAPVRWIWRARNHQMSVRESSSFAHACSGDM